MLDGGDYAVDACRWNDKPDAREWDTYRDWARERRKPPAAKVNTAGQRHLSRSKRWRVGAA
jgi:hypothetical protein